MNLSTELISQFVKATKDDKKTTSESTVYGTTVVYGGKTYVRLDGSDLLTPVSTTTDVKDDERVTVLIKDHTATITGNMSSPAARTEDVQVLGDKITEAEILIADKVSTKQLEAETARIDTLVSDNVYVKEKLTANEAEIDNLVADNVTINEKLTANEATIKKLDAEKLNVNAADIKFATIESLEAIEGEFHTLESTYGEFKELTTTNFNAINADIKNLETDKLSAEQADIKYVNIDFANIDSAWFEEFYAKSGIIEDIIVSEGKITGELVGVTIKGDLIEGNTIKADKLVVKGEDGIYYKLNFEGGTFAEGEAVPDDGLHGSVIVANSITAEKIAVDDLVAFNATIGGFHITNSSIYSGVKASVDNTTTGIYLDKDGQIAIGDTNNYLKYYKDQNGVYKLAISADSILFSASNKSIEESINEALDAANEVKNTIDNIEIGGRNLLTALSSQNEVINDTYVHRTLYLYNFEELVPGELYTISFKGDLPDDGTSWYLNITSVDENGNESYPEFISTFELQNGRWAGTGYCPEYVNVTDLKLYSTPLNTLHSSNTITSLVKLEKGNKPTDWTPAPEDLAPVGDLNTTKENIQEIQETVANLSIESNEIKASVENVESTVNNITGELEITKSEVASMKLESDALSVEIQKLNDDGVKKVVTTTGTFDEEGLMIDKSDSPTKTQVTPDGMTVYKKDTGSEHAEVLAATSDGVDATNLHAKTYLIIGGRSRFENYGSDRTGCFWIGG